MNFPHSLNIYSYPNCYIPYCVLATMEKSYKEGIESKTLQYIAITAAQMTATVYLLAMR